MPFYGTGTLLFSDDFTYSDGNLVTVGTAKWNEGFWTGQTSLRVVSNQAAGPASAAWKDNYSKTSFSVGANGIEFIVNNITAHLNPGSGAYAYNHVLASAGASPSGYWFRWHKETGFTYAFGKLINGTFTTFISTSQAVVDGDSLCLQILPDGTISLFRKPSGGSWAQIGASVTNTERTSGVLALETFTPNDRWDSVEVREVPGSGGGEVTPTISWVSIAASVDAAAPFTVTPNMPSHAADDILVCFACKNDAANLTCATAGWAEIVPAENNANFSTAWFWKRATSGAETTPVITSSTAGSTSTGIYATMARIRGCIATGTPFEDPTLNGGPTLSTTPQSSLITTTGPKRLVLAVAAMDDNNTITVSPPADWAASANTGSDTGGDAKHLGITKAVDVAGDVAAVTMGTQSGSDYWKTLTLAFIPIPVTVPSRLKRWNGSAWVQANLKKHNGSIWAPANFKKLP